MTEQQQQFLDLAIIERLNYTQIEKAMGIPKSTFRPWWYELEKQRLHLIKIRNYWQKKCSDVEFQSFKSWYESTDKRCRYCRLTESKITQLWEKYPVLTKRRRGKNLEIDRMNPNLEYSDLPNLVFCCYWCNNAKTDTFTHDEFQMVGKVFRQIWDSRLGMQ